MVSPTTGARLARTSCRRGIVGSPVRTILFKKDVGQCAHLRNGWTDVRMTQTPALHSTPLAPGMSVQSTPPAPTHPPHDSTFSFVSMHSNVAFSPGIGHSVCLGSSQGASGGDGLLVHRGARGIRRGRREQESKTRNNECQIGQPVAGCEYEISTEGV